MGGVAHSRIFMNTSPILSEADHSRLISVLEKQTVPCLDAQQHRILSDWLADVHVTADHSSLARCVALDDYVTLVSPVDSRDWFKLAIVLPEDAEVDLDRVPVLAPVSRAVLGRESGARVLWDAPGGTREMTIVAIRKRELLPK